MPVDHGFPFSGIELGWNSFLFSFVIVAAKGLIWLIGFGIGLGKTGFFFFWWKPLVVSMGLGKDDNLSSN